MAAKDQIMTASLTPPRAELPRAISNSVQQKLTVTWLDYACPVKIFRGPVKKIAGKAHGRQGEPILVRTTWPVPGRCRGFVPDFQIETDHTNRTRVTTLEDRT